ncbi:MAG: hypothetical protein FWD88_02010 [Treponema sp.]|nr:hypothetical protein [Treponema sp.]
MGFFCLMWVPLFYFLRRSIVAGSGGGGIWALLLGSIVVLIQFFVGPLVDPGGFGFYRWLSGFVDIVSVPVLAPLVLYLFLVEMERISPKTNYANFTLLWLVPLSAFRAMDWISPPTPVMLVLVPVLWTALAVGIPSLLATARKRQHLVVPAAFGIAVLPFAAATSWWAFFAHRPALGVFFLLVSIAPAMVSLFSSFMAMVLTKGQMVSASETVTFDESETATFDEKEEETP